MADSSTALPAPPEECDVVIAGAGAAGLLFAARFASAGWRVVVLEPGPERTLGDLVSSQLWARRLKWGAGGVAHGGSHPFGHAFATGWGTGGSALHHYAGWPRLHPADFRLQSQHGRGLDWPIDYDTLRPWYDRIQRELGVSGDAAREPWRPPGEPYPMPPLRVPPHGEIVAQGFRKLGMRVAPAPLAINSVVYRNRAACQHDGWCDAGCPIGALANPLIVHHPQALANGARVLTRHAVVRVRMATKERAAGVDVVGPDGVRHTLRAGLVVLAAGAVQNARLLLESTSPGHENGLGNATGLVGRHFHCHTVVTTYGLFEQATEPHLGVNAGSLICQDGYEKARAGKPFGSYQWGLGQAVKPNDLLGIANTRPDLYGARLHEFMRTASRHIAMMSAVCETMPQAENRIELDAERDANGLRRARIVHTLAPESLELRSHVDREGLDIMRAAGAREAWAGVLATTHALGGTVMGRSLRDSVTDDHGRLHDVANVYVAGGGLFPTGGAASPTFTLYALADRTTEHLLRHPPATLPRPTLGGAPRDQAARA